MLAQQLIFSNNAQIIQNKSRSTSTQFNESSIHSPTKPSLTHFYTNMTPTNPSSTSPPSANSTNISSVEIEWLIALISLLCAIAFACLALLMCLLYARKSARCRDLEECSKRLNTNNTSASDRGYLTLNTLPQSQPTSSRSHRLSNEYDDVNTYDRSNGVTASSGLTGQENIISRASFEATYETPDDNFISSVSASENKASLGQSISKVEKCTRMASGFATSRFATVVSMSGCSSSVTCQEFARSTSLLPTSSRKPKPQSSPPPPPSEETSSTFEATYEEVGPGIELTQLGSAASSAAAAAITPSTDVSASANADCQC